MDSLASNITVALIGVLGVLVGAILTPVVQDWLSRRRLTDKEIFDEWQRAFDRPAFRGRYDWHSDKAPFQQAIADTSLALHTGVRVSRSGRARGKGAGIKDIKNPDWREKMRVVERRLNKISKVVQGLEQPPPGQTPADIIDSERDEIIKTLNEIWSALKLPELPIPTAPETIYNPSPE